MRTILFRGKRLDNGEWVESMTISQGTIKRKRDCVYLEISEGNWVGVDPATVGQFTGLTDKNGQRIFEGDILGLYCLFEEESINREVHYLNSGFCVGVEDETDIQPIENVVECMDATIIGNIHDNPELLKTE